MSPSRLEQALTAIGPVMAQLFGQTEAPMMISMLPPAEHFRAGREHRHASGWPRPGGPAPLVTVGIMASDGTAAAAGASGARSSCAARW